MMKKIYSVAALLLFVSLASAQKNNETDQVRKQVIDQIYYHATQRVMPLNIHSSRISWLTQNATENELKLLLNHNNNIVRCQAFLALSMKPGADVFPLLLQHINDDTYFSFERVSCMNVLQNVGDFVIDVVTTESYKWNYPNSVKLNNEQIKKLDETVIMGDYDHLYYKKQLLLNFNPEEKYYQRITEMVAENNKREALVALAKYRKQNDISIIKKSLSTENEDVYYALLAVKEFPSEAFLPELKAIQNELINIKGKNTVPYMKAFYEAVLQYDEPVARKLLEHSLKGTKGIGKKFNRINHHEGIWIAIEKYQPGNYESISKKLKIKSWEEESLRNRIN